ncbi:MAG: hypothetical protein ACR2OY_08225 [Boseongicola sp.]
MRFLEIIKTYLKAGGVAMGLHLLLLIPVAAQADHMRCGVPISVIALVELTDELSGLRGRIPDVHLRRVRQALTEVERALAKRVAGDLGLGDQGVLFRQLAEQISDVVLTHRIARPAKLRARLRKLQRAIDVACNSSTADSRDAKPTESSTGSPAPAEIGNLQDWMHSLLTDKSGSDSNAHPIYILFILLILAGTLGFVGLVHIAYTWVFSLIFNRKSCLILATLEIGLEVVDGTITVLGRRGLRFQPVNQGAFKRIEGLVGTGKPFIVVGPHRLATNLTGLHGVFVSMLFPSRISLALQEKLLESSLVTPHHVKKDIPKSNIDRIQRRGPRAPS